MSAEFPFESYKSLLTLLATTPGPPNNEQPRAEALMGWLREHDMPPEQDSAGSVWVSFGEGPWEETLIIDGHIDVVGRGVADDVIQKNGRLIGAGVGDNLTTVSMLCQLGERLRDNPPARPLKIIFSVGEEGLGDLRGVRQMVADHPAPPWAFISFDGGMRHYSTGGIGSRRFRVSFTGPGGHSLAAFGKPNAIEHALDAVHGVREDWREIDAGDDERVTFNLGEIRGGEGVNCIAREAEVVFEFRSTSEAALAALDERVEARVKQAARVKELEAVLARVGQRPAARPVEKDRIEPTALKIFKDLKVETKDMTRSTNINAPLAAGWPSICLGLYNGGNGHREDEYIEIESLDTGWAFLTRLIRELTERS